MRRAAALFLATALLALVIPGCAPPQAEREAQVVVTTNILGDVAQQVLGSQAHVTTLMRPNADPHSFGISAQEAALLSRADLVVSNGLGLEEGLQQHLDRAAAAGVPMLVAGDVVPVLPYSSGDGEGTPDPHFWTDPLAMRSVVDAVEAAARGIAGLDQQELAANAAAYRARLTQLDADMAAAFAAVPAERRALVTNHHVFGYLADRYGFRVVGTAIPGGTTLAAPSAGDLRQLSQAIRQAGVPTIFAESSQPDRLVQALAGESGVNVRVTALFTESLTAAGGGAPTYLEMMRANTARIVQGLAP